MLRYLRRLSARDYALDRGMIPLGSCTMKLNATTEMEPVSLPGLRRPAPVRAGRGRRSATASWSSSSRAGWPRSPATTRSRSSRTPARRASSPGCSRSAATTGPTARASRNVCLIPSSAHGTNAASAVMAGMKVVVVKAGRRRLGRPRRPARAVRGAHATTSPRSWSPTRRRTAPTRTRITELCEIVHDARRPGVRRRRQPQRAARATPGRVSSAATSPTSTCTRRSASRTAAAARASARSRCARTWRRTCPRTRMHPEAGEARRASARSARRRTARRASCRSRGPTSG